MRLGRRYSQSKKKKKMILLFSLIRELAAVSFEIVITADNYNQNGN